MDYTAAFRKVAEPTKSAWKASADATANTLDALAPAFAPFAARWDAEADRRMALRTPENLKALIDAQRAHTSARSTAATAASQRRAARAASKNPFNSARRAARTADKAATGHAKVARSKLKEAKKNYPMTLRQLAVRVHAAHVVPAGVASYVMSTPDDWAMWPAGTSLGLIALNAGALFLGRREVRVQLDDDLSAEERRLMERLAPTYWVQHAEERGLSGTLTEHPEITAAGIVCGVRLDGRWSAKALAAQADQVRALLGMKTETRMQISRGSHGDRALIVIRTRSASDGVSMIWTPDHVGIGVDEVTGEFVDLPLKAGTHILAAGRTGMGKSVSWRPLVMRAVMDDDWTAIVIDPKRQEAIGWQHCLRCVGQETDREERLARIYGMAQELTREMHRRQGMATGSTWVPDGRPENRNLLVVIDEGAAIVRMSKQKQYADVLDLFEELWSEARSVGFQFVWATQFPTKAVGVPAAVKENMSAFLSLTVNPGEAERAIFGETAQQEGWLPSKLDGIPGRAMLQYKKRTPDPLRLWHVTDGMIAGLPKAEPWHSPVSTLPAVPAPAPAPEVEAVRPALRLVKDGGDFLLAPPAAEAPAVPDDLTDNQRAVLTTVRDGASTNAEIAKATGLNPGSVARAVDALVKRGLLAKDGTEIRIGGAA
ncbi:winged helix-turn-helix transcriptional regulator [Streptomyces sp. NPDC052682]|uniref:winged helix-turn-helix transcriptional regulator n=1 Tax=Streptomyces sp. NPDC052682 TaxID=3154954 RepID=UPI00343F65D3